MEFENLIRIKLQCHEHELRKATQLSNWFCDSMHNLGGCKSSQTGKFPQNTSKYKYRCDKCDFDLCLPCVEREINKEVKS